MPYTIKPGSFKYKKSNGQFSEIDCFEGPDLTEEVAALEKGKAQIIIDSATGNPIVLKDGADSLPVEGMKIHFLPKQNLNGQSAPYPPGDGANKLPCPTTASTQTTSGVTLVVDGNGQYKISGSNNSGSSINFTFNVQSQYIGNAQYLHCMNDKIGSVSGGVRIYLFNDDTQVDFVGFTGANRIYNGGSALNGKTINKIQIRIMDGCSVDGVLTFTPMLLDTSSVTEWTPYSNICPISGWQGLTAWRTGINVWDEECEVGAYNTSTGAKTGTSAGRVRSVGFIPVIPGVSYKVVGDIDGICYYDKNKNYLSYSINNSVITIPDNCYFITFYSKTNYGSIYNHDISLNYPSDETEYHAYTGASYPVTFPVVGKNLLPTQETIRSGNTTYIGGSDYWIPLKAGTYTMSEGGTPAYLYWRKKGTTDNNIIHTSASHSGSFTLEEDSYVRFWYYAGSNDATYSDIMLNAGDTALPYKPFTNTIYGGTLDAVNGVLTVEWTMVTFDGSQPNNKFGFDTVSSTIEPRNRISWVGIYSEDGGIVGGKYISDKLIGDSTYVQNPSIWHVSNSGSAVARMFIGVPTTITSVAEWQTYVTQNPITVAYKLATPYEIQLDPITVQTLIGDNTIWSDANGTIELDYRADTKLFCQKNDSVDDVRVNGTSVLNNGVANIPLANGSTWGAVKIGSGLYVGETSGVLQTNRASSAQIKAATNNNNPIVPQMQHESIFYGLAKLAGADMSSSSNAIGTFTPEAIVAIQKMLGVYQAPWELIREDNFVNDLTTASDHIITVDSNGQPFELTDVLMLFELPQNENTAEKGYYGQIWFYYDTDSVIAPEPGSASRVANGYSQGAWYMINYSNKIVTTQATVFATNTNSMYWRARYIQYMNGAANSNMGIFVANDFAITKINIRQVKGEGHYKLYGRRKWTT